MWLAFCRRHCGITIESFVHLIQSAASIFNLHIYVYAARALWHRARSLWGAGTRGYKCWCNVAYAKHSYMEYNDHAKWWLECLLVWTDSNFWSSTILDSTYHVVVIHYTISQKSTKGCFDSNKAGWCHFIVTREWVWNTTEARCVNVCLYSITHLPIFLKIIACTSRMVQPTPEVIVFIW